MDGNIIDSLVRLVEQNNGKIPTTDLLKLIQENTQKFDGKSVESILTKDGKINIPALEAMLFNNNPRNADNLALARIREAAEKHNKDIDDGAKYKEGTKILEEFQKTTDDLGKKYFLEVNKVKDKYKLFDATKAFDSAHFNEGPAKVKELLNSLIPVAIDDLKAAGNQEDIEKIEETIKVIRDELEKRKDEIAFNEYNDLIAKTYEIEGCARDINKIDRTFAVDLQNIANEMLNLKNEMFQEEEDLTNIFQQFINFIYSLFSENEAAISEEVQVIIQLLKETKDIVASDGDIEDLYKKLEEIDVTMLALEQVPIISEDRIKLIKQMRLKIEEKIKHPENLAKIKKYDVLLMNAKNLSLSSVPQNERQNIIMYILINKGDFKHKQELIKRLKGEQVSLNLASEVTYNNLQHQANILYTKYETMLKVNDKTTQDTLKNNLLIDIDNNSMLSQAIKSDLKKILIENEIGKIETKLTEQEDASKNALLERYTKIKDRQEFEYNKNLDDGAKLTKQYIDAIERESQLIKSKLKNIGYTEEEINDNPLIKKKIDEMEKLKKPSANKPFKPIPALEELIKSLKKDVPDTAKKAQDDAKATADLLSTPPVKTNVPFYDSKEKDEDFEGHYTGKEQPFTPIDIRKPVTVSNN